jgi:uncharacterized membrane protein YuzA (DUF378 family)
MILTQAIYMLHGIAKVISIIFGLLYTLILNYNKLKFC